MPWGIAAVTARERRQLDLGNALYRTTIIFAAICLATGTSAIVEHPAPPVWEPRCPSSWHMRETTWILSHQQANLHILDQCQFGCKAMKPTGLMAIHLNELGHGIDLALGRGRCQHRAHAIQRGRREDGSWHTSELKT